MTFSTDRMAKLGRTVGVARTVLYPYLGTRPVVGSTLSLEVRPNLLGKPDC